MKKIISSAIIILFFSIYAKQTNKRDVVDFSSYGYIEKIRSDLRKDEPYIFEYSLVCKKNNAYGIIAELYLGGKRKELRKRISIEKYLEVWKKIEQYDIWKLRKIDLDDIENPFWVINGEFKEELYPYEKSFSTQQTTFEFFIQKNDQKHFFSVYAIDCLKDKRYKKILDEIDKLFKDYLKRPTNLEDD